MKLSEIRKACEEATDGPWDTEQAQRFFGRQHVLARQDTIAFDCLTTNARFIALARSALPALVEFFDVVYPALPLDAIGAWKDEFRAVGIEVDE